MATKTKKATTRKQPASKVRDLTARKDPRGGAQKKEGPNNMAGMKRGGTLNRSKRNLS